MKRNVEQKRTAMKRILLSALFILAMLYRLQAQNTETHVTVHAGENALETVLTEEEKQTVKYLTVTGTLLDADYTFLRERLYGQLDTLNLRAANIDTLPDIRTEDILASRPNKIHLILPLNIEHIGVNFLSQFSKYYSLEVTGKFPTFGENSARLPSSYNTKVTLSDDNYSYRTETFRFPEEWQPKTYTSIYSWNGNIFYYMNIGVEGNYTIKEGTKIIHGTAFRNLRLPTFTLILPASLDSIGDSAFECTECPVLTGYGSSGDGIICYAIEPPKLGKDVFKNSVLEISNLYVHEVSIEKYKQADGWNRALDIRAIETMGQPPSHAYEQIHKKNISVVAMPDSYELTFTQKPIYMEMYSTNGILFTKQTIDSYTLSIGRNQLANPYTIARVYFDNGTTETIKLIP